MSEIEKFRKQKKFWSKEKKNIVIVVVAIIIIGVVAYSILAPRPKTIKVEGAFALEPMMRKWAVEYQKIHPDIRIDINANGAGAGMVDALKGIADIGMVSRAINNSEINRGAFWVSVCKDAVVATMNADNPVRDIILQRGITKQQFKDIFITGNISTWGQLVGDNSNTDTIFVYTRADACGAADTWAKFLGKYVQNDLGSGPGFKGSTRIAAVDGDNAVVASVQGNRLAIGYDNTGYVYTKKLADGTVVHADGIIPMPIDIDGNGILDSNESVYTNRSTMVNAIINNVYPSPPARVENLATLNSFKGISKDFVRWILTDGQKYVIDAGYAPLPSQTLALELQYLESGTRPEIS